MKKIRTLIISTVASAVVLLATAEVSTACVWFFYQPEVPQELQK